MLSNLMVSNPQLIASIRVGEPQSMKTLSPSLFMSALTAIAWLVRARTYSLYDNGVSNTLIIQHDAVLQHPYYAGCS